MNKIYCPHCSKATGYESIQPKICGFCGKSFISAFASTINKDRIEIPKIEPIVEEEEIQDIPNVKKIQIEIQGNLRGNRQTFDEVLQQGFQSKGPLVAPRPKELPGKKGKTKQLSPKQIQENWTKNFPKNGQKTEIG